MAHARPGEPEGLTKWIGWVLFAGLVLIVTGLLSLIQGLVALFDDDFYVVTPSGLPVNIDYTAWGWLLVVFGAVLMLTGYFVIFGYAWARIIAMVLTAVNAFVNLTFLAAYPIWSIVAIALDLIVIYALAVHGAEGQMLRRDRR
jgi:hypothetical protein